MLEIEIVKMKNINVIDSLLLHKELCVKSNHRDWLSRRIENYQFEEGVDYFRSKMSETKKIGRPSKSYLLSIDMAKELAMLENNSIGKSVRKWFIKRDKDLRKVETVQLASKEVRKALTDAVEESGEQERMHGHGYSTYTLMVYKLLGIKKMYQDWKKETKGKGDFRLTLEPDLRKRVSTAESMVKSLLELGNEYGEISSKMEELFEPKKIMGE